MAPRRMPGPMPWFKHPVRLLDSDQSRHLSHLLAASGDPSPEDAARSVVGLLWELAARCQEPGTITTPEAVIESALRKRGVVPMLIESGLAVRDDAGLHVVMFADLNERRASTFEADRERRRAWRQGNKASARVGRLSNDGRTTVGGGSADGRTSDADADAEEEKNSYAAAPAASTPAAPQAPPVPCGPTLSVTSDQLAARADGSTPPAQTSLFDDETTSAAETKPAAPRKPRKRADGTTTDTRIPEVIRGWEAAYRSRNGIDAPKLAPEAAGREYAAIGTLIRRIDPAMTSADIVGLLDHALMLAQGGDYEARGWRGLSLRALLADVNVAKLRLSKAQHTRAAARSWEPEGAL